VISEALARGLSAIVRPRLLLTYWLLSVVLSLGVALGYQALAFEATGQLPDPGSIAAEPASPWTEDFARANGNAMPALSRGAGAATWAWIFATTLLAGGLVRAFEARAAERRRAEGETWTLRVFLADAGRHAPRMLRLLAVTLVLAFSLDWLFNEALGEWHDQNLVAIESERLSVLTDWLRQGSFALSLFLLATWTDVARVQVVLERRGSVLAALASAANALLRRPVEILGLGGAFVAAEWIAMVVFAALLGRVRTDSFEQLGWWLLGSQALVLVRLGLGFARVAAYTAVGEDLRADRELRLSPGAASTL
jgi:hypothetical protein